MEGIRVKLLREQSTMAPLLAHLHESGQALTNDISCIEPKSSTEIKTTLDFIFDDEILKIHFIKTTKISHG